MSNSKKCLDPVLKAAKGSLNEKQVINMLEQLDNELSNATPSIKELIDTGELTDVFKEKQLLKKWNFLNNKIIENNLTESIDFSSKDALTKSYDQKMINIEKRINDKIKQADAVFKQRLEKADVLEHYSLNKFDDVKVSEFMARLTVKDKAKAPTITDVDPEFHAEFRIAQAMAETLNESFKRKKALGVDIQFLDGRILRNSYTGVQMGSPKVQANFKNDMLSDTYMDWERIDLGNRTREEFVNDLLNKLNNGQDVDEVFTNVTGNSTVDLSQKLGKSRAIILKPEKWLEFQKKYGDGDLRTMFKNELLKDARSEAMLQNLGSEPEKVYNNWIGRIHQKSAQFAKGGKKVLDGRAENYYNYISGRLNNPKDYLKSRVGNSMRQFMQATHLGGVTITSFADMTTPGIAKMLLTKSDNAFTNLRIMGESLSEQFSMLVGQYGDDYAKRIAKGALEEFEDTHFTFSMESRFGGDFGGVDIEGRPNGIGYSILNTIDDTNRLISKFNFNDTWTKSALSRQYPVIAREWGEFADVGFNKLPDGYQQQLKNLQVDDIWDLMRSKVYETPDGRKYIDPKAFDELTDTDVRKYSKTAQSKKALENARQELKDRFRAAFSQEAETRVLIPDISTSPNVAAGSAAQAGTIMGEFTRSMFQFKSYGIAYWKKLLGPAFTQGGLVGGASAAVAITPFVLGTNMMITWFNDLLNGKTPRPFYFDDEEDVEAVAANWGGLISRSMGYPFLEETFGKVAAGEFTAFDVSRLFGPSVDDTVKTLTNVSGVVGGARDGDIEKVNKNLTRLTLGAPVINPLLHGHIAGKVVKNLVDDPIKEWASPGYLDDKARFAEEQGSEYAPNYEAVIQFLQGQK